MKYILISALFAVISFGAAPLVSAQQQINNDGANGGELQQNNNGNALQNAQAGQSTSPVTQNGGAKILQNSPNTNLTVTGEPQPTVPTKNKSIIGWVLLAVTLLFLLMSPALMYARNLSQKEQTKPKQSKKELTPKDEVKVKATETIKIDESPNNQEPKKPTPKKKHKKSTNKVKRGKKKK